MITYDKPESKTCLAAKVQGAFLAAAVGDALGWPQEDRSKRVGKPVHGEGPATYQFTQWSRGAGGRFYAHEEVIAAGEYSDDTQLLLCTARSIFLGPRWLEYFTKRELPTWSLYERGAGGATKRAVDAWISGKAPWSSDLKEDYRRRYFEAGGNGVAMRIMPHLLANLDAKNFTQVASDIFANGIATHGHPRALVGGLAFGYTVWQALKKTNTLQYGELLNLVIGGKDSWSQLPLEQSNANVKTQLESWLRAANEISGGQYEEWWSETVREMEALLESCQEALKQGAMLFDEVVLKELGCYDRKINGSGTVSAAAAVFLASYYAADSINGLKRAAFAQKADTDTLASMTGSILGAIHGADWLGSYTSQLQDAPYIKRIAQDLLQIENPMRGEEAKDVEPVRKAQIDYVFKDFKSAKTGGVVRFPDGRQGEISSIIRHPAKSKKASVTSWKVVVSDGQTLYVKRISRGSERDEEGTESQDVANVAREEAGAPMDGEKIGVKVKVHDLRRSKLFYCQTLGLRVSKETERSVILENVIALVLTETQRMQGGQQHGESGPIICIQTKALDKVFERVVQSAAKIVLPISAARSQGRLFQCFDPDLNTVELFER